MKNAVMAKIIAYYPFLRVPSKISSFQKTEMDHAFVYADQILSIVREHKMAHYIKLTTLVTLTEDNVIAINDSNFGPWTGMNVIRRKVVNMSQSEKAKFFWLGDKFRSQIWVTYLWFKNEVDLIKFKLIVS